MTRRNIISCIFLILSFTSPLLSQQIKQSPLFEFYSEQITLNYDVILLQTPKVRLGYRSTATGKQEAQMYYEQLQNTEKGTLLTNLQTIRTKYALNDWFYYELLTEAVDVIAKGKNKQHRTLLKWYLLNQSGYDCRITYWEKSSFLNVYTNDDLYEVPILTEGMRNYANLSSWQSGKAMLRSLYMLDYAPNPKGRAFSFALQELPRLKAENTARTLQFSTETLQYEIDFLFDQTAVNIMKNYPVQEEGHYPKIPFSETAAQSLIPKLSEIIADKNKQEALEIIASFTRSAFPYKKDEDYFGKSRPMTAEEVFHYPYSDCEDRCALFFILTKELLDIPRIVMAYDDHVTVAVDSEGLVGEVFSYGNQKYVVCDPTGPSNSSEIGFFPEGYKKRAFEVIARHR